jgi:arsenate reductase-like glutaredoxin family protein
MKARDWLQNNGVRFNHSHFYPNPLGDGKVCELAVTSGNNHVKRSATGRDNAEAANLAAELVARALGWKPETEAKQ